MAYVSEDNLTKTLHTVLKLISVQAYKLQLIILAYCFPTKCVQLKNNAYFP